MSDRWRNRNMDFRIYVAPHICPAIAMKVKTAVATDAQERHGGNAGAARRVGRSGVLTRELELLPFGRYKEKLHIRLTFGNMGICLLASML